MSKSQKLTRVVISCAEDNHLSNMNVYVDYNPQLKVGSYITLPDSEKPEILWIVNAIHETIERTSIKYGWNNNI